MLPEDSIIIQREMSRIVVTITYGREIIYCSPLSAHRLNELALNELNHLCLQLGFQRVLGSVRSIVLWLEEGDITEIERVTGLPARREVQPAPFIPTRGQSSLVPSEILSARLRHQSKARTRALVLSAGLAMAACVAVMAVMISYATRQRDMLLEEVADLSPRASQVLDHKKSWLEAAPAVDPTFFPMQVLLDSMTPSSSREVSLTNFEWNPDRLVLRGRMPSAALALQYANEITEVENLTRFVWETPAPTIASDNSATFELTGEIKP
jgi:predicted small secreted protein